MQVWLKWTFIGVLVATISLLTLGCSLSGDEEVDGDSDSLGDEDLSPDGDSDEDGDSDVSPDGDIEGVPTCEETWPIPDEPWQPETVYTDETFAHEETILIEGDGVPAFAALAVLTDDKVLAAADTGIYELSTLGDVTKLALWPSESFIDITALDGGEWAAGTAQSLYWGNADAAPQSLAVAGELSIVAIEASDDEGVWVVTNDGAISHVDLTNPAFTVVVAADTAYSVNDLWETDSALWLATSAGLYRAELPAGTANPVFAPADMPVEAVTGVVGDAAGGLWMASSAGLLNYADDNLTLIGGAEGLPYANLLGLDVASDARLLIPTDKGLITYKTADSVWDYYHLRYWVPDWDIRDAVVTAEGRLFVATATGASVITPVQRTLEAKAAILDDGMATRHNRYGMFSHCSLATPGDLSTAYTSDDDNDGQWTNMYLASQVFRYLVTESSEARDLARQAAAAMLRLLTVTGKAGFFARSVVEPERCEQMTAGEWHLSDDEQWCWKGDTSSDEFVGHVFGLSLYYDYLADEDEQILIRDTFVNLLDGMIANGYTLEDIDGKPTTHGLFSPDFIQTGGTLGDAGLNSAMILGGLKATYRMSGEERFLNEFNYLADDEGYTDFVRRVGPIIHTLQINHDSEEMAFLALTTLIRLEDDPCRMAAWQEGLRGLWDLQVPEHNPEFNFIYAWLSRPDDFKLQESVQTLKEFYLHGITWPEDNTHRIDVTLDPEPDRHGDLQAYPVLPYDQKQAFRWAENPFGLTHGGSGSTERMLTPWLLPYWLGRYLGVISSGQ